MARYLISFNYGSMEISADELPEVARASKAVIREAQEAGVVVFAGGVGAPRETTLVARDGSATEGPNHARSEFIGGMTVVEVDSRAEALAWAEKIAASCRCAQEVREFMPGSVTQTD